MHINPPPANLDENYKRALEKVNIKIKQKYMEIADALEAEDFEKALGLIWSAAEALYMMNQKYTDDFLEVALLCLNEKLSRNKTNHFKHKKNTVLYYDRPALDNHSLTPIFLDALGAIGLHIVYATRYVMLDKIPKITEVVKKYNGEIRSFNSHVSMLDTYNSLCDLILQVKPEYMFYYPFAQDDVGLLAFMRFKGSAKRYLLDITDHAFWIGRNAFDYFGAGRDYQASISAIYRGIPENKLVEYHYAPSIQKDVEFQGFPFEKQEGDFIIFSGGAPYKAADEQMTFYNIVANVMGTHKNVKFWYAMNNPSPHMKLLIDTFPGRVFNTDKRSDLFQVLKNIDLYLNTYPMYGGSMMTFAAAAGLPPFTLKFGDESSGLLKNQESLGIMFNTPKEIFNAIHRYILDSEYRNELKQNMAHSLYTREEMIEYFKQMVFNPKTHTFNIKEPDTANFRAWHFKAFLDIIVERLGVEL